jgi:hypothetical protein
VGLLAILRNETKLWLLISWLTLDSEDGVSTFLYNRSLDISVTIAKGYGLDGRGSITVKGRSFSSLHHVLQAVSGAKSAYYQWYWRLFPFW